MRKQLGAPAAAAADAATKGYVDTAAVKAYAGQTPTVWYGTQAAYNALPTATTSAASFIAVVKG